MNEDQQTIDLQDRVEEIESELARIKAEAAELDQDSAEYRQLAEEYEELEEAKTNLESDIDEFGGNEVTIKRFKASDAGLVTDLTLADTIDDGADDPRAKLEARKLHTIEVGVTSGPPELPDDPGEFETPTKEFLYEKINNLNRFGRTTVEDFSLTAALSDEP